MGKLTPDQRNYLCLLEAERAGIHKSILVALHSVHNSPDLADGETGLGISPANRIPLDQVNHFSGQVTYAANTIRSLTDGLLNEGLNGNDLWDMQRGQYAEKFLQAVSRGYAPPASETAAARLEPSDFTVLNAAYQQDWDSDARSADLPENLNYLDSSLLAFADRLANHYNYLLYQREAMLEALRIWRKLDTQQVTIKALRLQLPNHIEVDAFNESYLDTPLLQFVQQVSRNYMAYPNQREALIRLVQLWQQLESREATIAFLSQSPFLEIDLKILDPALITFVQKIPVAYQGKGQQRNALVEGYRTWHQLESRSSVLIVLGINPDILSAGAANPTEITQAAAQLDRALLEFLRQLPHQYQATGHQREALLRLIQLWQNLPTREKTIQLLIEEIKQMEQAQPDSPEPRPQPSTIGITRRPEQWTPENIQLYAPIVPNGNFLWAEATDGGCYMPGDQFAIDAIVRMAMLVQSARDRLGKPFHIVRWYFPTAAHPGSDRRYQPQQSIGDALEFYCQGLTSHQIYWFLDAWWPGGLGRYHQFPYLNYLDARSYRARWCK